MTYSVMPWCSEIGGRAARRTRINATNPSARLLSEFSVRSYSHRNRTRPFGNTGPEKWAGTEVNAWAGATPVWAAQPAQNPLRRLSPPPGVAPAHALTL